MARIPKPTELLRLSGAYEKDPQRHRGEVPKSPDPIGDPPSGMETEAATAWNELVACCVPGVLTGADRIILEITSNLLAEYRQDPPAFQVGKYRVIVSCFARLGLSPADRTQLKIEKPVDDSVFGPL